MLGMVSFEAEKRKFSKSTWEDDERESKRSRKVDDEETKPLFDIEIQAETPLPLEWQRCLDIKSGQIHFYNTRTQKRTWEDPRRMTSHMSLNLELNLLPCDHPPSLKESPDGDLLFDSRKHRRWSSWLGFDEQQLEMVATVCVKCHMLVMLCKSSPACPNCKFMHQTRPPLFKESCKLLC